MALTRPEDSALALRRAVPSVLPRRTMGDMEGRALALTRPEDSALALRRAIPSALPRRAMGDMGGERRHGDVLL